MADTTQKILSVQLEATDAINGIVRLNDAIDANNKQMALNKQAIAENNKAMKESGADTMALAQKNEELTKTNVELSAQTKELTNERRILQKEVQNEIRANAAAEGSLKSLRAQLSNLTKQFDGLSKAERQNEQVGGALMKQINEVTNEIKQAEEETQRYFRNVGNYPEAMGSVKGAMRTMQQEIMNLTLQYREMDDEMKRSDAGVELKNRIDQLTQQASKYKDVMSDVSQSIQRGASDTAALNALAEGAKVLTASFGLAQNAAAALGITNDSLQKSMLKIQQAMQAVQALTVIQNALQKQSNLMKGIALIQSKAMAASEALEAKVKAQATGATIAQTAAQKAYNIVANANPYVLLATAILTVIGLVVGYTNALGDNTEAEKENAEAQKKNTEAAEREAEAQKRLAEAMKITTDEAYKRKKVENEMADDVASSVSKQIVNYTFLQKKWKECGDDVKLQQKFLSDYKTELNNTGFAIKNIYDAHNVLVKQADNVIKMYYALAEAAAAAAVAEDAFKRIIERKAKNTVNYTKLTDIRNASGAELDWLVKNGYFRKGENNASESQMLDAINNRRIEEARAAWRKENEADQKIIDYAMKRQNDANNNAKKLQGIIGTTYGTSGISGGKTGGKSKGGSSSKKTATKKAEKTPQQIALEEFNKRVTGLIEEGGELRRKALEEESKENIKAINELADLELQELYKKYGDRSQYEGEALAAWDAAYNDIENRRLQKIKDYNKKVEDAEKQAAAERIKQEQELQAAIVEGLPEGSVMRLNAQLDNLQMLMDAELAMYENNERMIQAVKAKYGLEAQKLQQDYARKEIEIQQQKYEAIANIVGGLGQVLSEFGDDQKAFVILQKTLALAEVAINQGVAISAAIKNAATGSITVWDMIAQIATGITSVTVAMVQAFKSIDSAKFATGGYVRGAGTSTSDSIPIRVSNGESIMNANTTAMFSGLLSSLNQLGGGVPIQVQQSASSIRGEDMLARAVARGVAMLPAPVVSVEDINRGQRQVQVMTERATL